MLLSQQIVRRAQLKLAAMDEQRSGEQLTRAVVMYAGSQAVYRPRCSCLAQLASVLKALALRFAAGPEPCGSTSLGRPHRSRVCNLTAPPASQSDCDFTRRCFSAR